MLDSLGLVLLGAGVGALGTLIGAGGGFVLVPILAIVAPSVPTSAITAVSLGMVAANAASGTVAYLRRGRVDVASAVPFALATIPGGVVGALLTRAIPRGIFDPAFAVVLVAIAVFVVVRHRDDRRRPVRDARHRWDSLREVVESDGTAHRYRVDMPLGVALSFGVGLFSSLLGIGGGIVHVPLLVGLLGFPAHLATATSHFVLAVTATAGTATHLVAGDLDGLLAQTAALGVGAILGAQVGARLSTRVGGVFIVRMLAAALVIVAARLAAQAMLRP